MPRAGKRQQRYPWLRKPCGPVRVQSNEVNIPRFRSQRTIALLGYLVAEQRAVSRDALAALLSSRSKSPLCDRITYSSTRKLCARATRFLIEG